MPITRLDTSQQITLVLTGISLLEVFAFILCILALSAGSSQDALRRYAILTFDTSSVNRALSNATLATSSSIQDWYEAHYLSICSGMWNTHTVSAGKNSSTVTCASQTGGYTFSLAQIFARSSNASQPQPQPLPIHWPSSSSYGTLDTKAALILLAIGIALTGLSVLFFLFGVIIMLVRSTAKMPLSVVRVAYLASIAAPIFLTISSAKITSLAEKTTGTADVNVGGVAVAVHAWMESGFYAFTWLGTALMWVVVVLSIAAAFKFASALQIRDPLSLGK